MGTIPYPKLLNPEMIHLVTGLVKKSSSHLMPNISARVLNLTTLALSISKDLRLSLKSDKISVSYSAIYLGCEK